MMSPIEMQEKACRNRRNGDGNKKNNIIILSLDKIFLGSVILW